MKQASNTVSNEAGTTIPPETGHETDAGMSGRRTESLQTLQRSLDALCTAWRGHAGHMASTHGLSGPQFAVFMALAAEQPLTMGQIGERSDLPTSSLTALVDRLAELRLVRRETHPVDRRAIRVHLTEDGRVLAERVLADTLRATAQITAGIEDSQIDRTSAAIEDLLTGYRQYAAQTGRGQARPAPRRAAAPENPGDTATPGHDPDERSHVTRSSERRD